MDLSSLVRGFAHLGLSPLASELGDSVAKDGGAFPMKKRPFRGGLNQDFSVFSLFFTCSDHGDMVFFG
jgi:hypothetical protein